MARVTEMAIGENPNADLPCHGSEGPDPCNPTPSSRVWWKGATCGHGWGTKVYFLGLRDGGGVLSLDRPDPASGRLGRLPEATQLI